MTVPLAEVAAICQMLLIYQYRLKMLLFIYLQFLFQVGNHNVLIFLYVVIANLKLKLSYCIIREIRTCGFEMSQFVFLCD